MQGCLSCRKPSDDERYIYVGDGNPVEVEAIGTFRLLLRIGFYLDLIETHVVPSLRWNFVSIPVSDTYGYCCSFGNGKVIIYQNSNLGGSGSLLRYDNLYLLDNIASFNESLHVSTLGIKCKLTNENSASLWHKRLGHISKRRIERLMSDGILNPLDFMDFDTCVNCIKGKKTNVRRLDANRSLDVLELIHTDIYGPFPTASWNGQTYFITFIDDLSRYGYLYLIHDKSQSLDVFRNYKSVRFDRGGEYCDRYDGSGEQRLTPFAKFLEECGIIPHYTMPGTPTMNGVAERRNIRLKYDQSFYLTSITLGKALKTVVYILNRAPTKATDKTPYEIWTGKRRSLNHLHIWECPAEAWPHRPNEKKLDSRTISCYFIGYSKRSKGYKFYDPTTKAIFETRNARFFEDVEFVEGEKIKDFVFEEEHVEIPLIVFDNDQVQDSIPNIVQEAIPDQDNVVDPFAQVQRIVSEEQTLQPQEPMPIK